MTHGKEEFNGPASLKKKKYRGSLSILQHSSKAENQVKTTHTVVNISSFFKQLFNSVFLRQSNNIAVNLKLMKMLSLHLISALLSKVSHNEYNSVISSDSIISLY